MRNLTKALAAVSLLVPASGHSLGIGDIKLHSALNQNLKAEIALVVSANEDASDIKVRLAPPEKFDEAGVPWSYFLSKIKFKTETQSNGNVVVRVTSSEALKEPFLDMLLEVTWPKGSLYREFTVLIDPSPTYAQQKSVAHKKQPKTVIADKSTDVNFAQEKKHEPVKKTSRSSANYELTQSKFQPTSSDSTENSTIKVDSLGTDDSSKPAAKIDSLGVDNEPKASKPSSKIDALGFDDEPTKVAPTRVRKAKPAVAKTKSQHAPIPVVAEKTETTSDSAATDKDGGIKVTAKDKTAKDSSPVIETSAKQYGPTKKKSNLYRIAKEVNSDPDISVEQMMYAIYNANPEAFYDDNINSLRANQHLKIPTRDAILKTGIDTPKKTGKLHHKAKPEVASTSESESIETKRIPIKSKKHLASKLKLRPPHENKIAKKHEVAPAAAIESEDSNKLSNANQDLQIQLKKMQTQLTEMEKILSLKNQKLALLEKQLEGKTTDKKLAEVKSSTEKTVADKKALEDKAKAAADKIAADKAIADAKTAAEKKALEDKAKADAEAKAKADKIAADKAIADAKTAAEKKALEDKAKADAEAKAKADKIAADKAIADAKTAAEKKALEDKAKADAEAKAKADKIAADKAIADAKTAAEKKALEDKAKADAEAKAKADKIAADKAIADAKTAAEKKALEDKAKADAEAKAKADKIAADKAIADAKTAAEKKALEDKAKADAEAKAKADKIAADKAIADAKTAAEKKALEDKAKADAEAKAKAATTSPQLTPPAAQASPPAMVAQVAPKKPLTAAPEPPVEEDWMTDPYTLAAAGGGVLSLGVLGFLFWRKRKVESSTEVESMFTESSEINLPDDEDEFSVPGIDEASSFMFGGESSFLSDDNDFDAFEVDQDEVDPISEADVYLAYGRYQQAEELIRQAIEDLPDRDECKFKLLEIFCVNGNAQGFEQYVQELASAGKMSNRSFWSKVIEMGREIIPNSPLLTMPEENEDTSEHEAANKLNDAIAAETLSSAAALDDEDFESDLSIFDDSDKKTLEKQDDSLKKNPLTEQATSQTTLSKSQEQLSPDDFDLSIFDEEEIVTGKSNAAGSDTDLDLSVFGDESSVAKADPVKTQESVANNMDFSSSMFDDEPPAAKTEPVANQEPPANNMDFDLSMFDDEPPAAKTEPVANQEPPANNMDFDLSMFDDEPPAAKTEPVANQEPPANNMDFDLSMFDDEPPAAKTEPVANQEPPANNVDFDLSMFDDEPPAAKTEPVANQEPPANNVDFDLSMFDDEPPAAKTEPVANQESPANNMDFDLSMFDDEPPAAKTEPVANQEPPANNVDFDLSMFDDEPPAAKTEPVANQEPPANNVDFDLSMFDDEPPAAKTKPIANQEPPTNNVEFDLSSFDAVKPANVSGIEPEAEFDASDFGDIAESFDTEIENAESDFDLSSFDAVKPANVPSAEPEIEFDVSDFADIAESFDTEIEKTKTDFDLPSFEAAKPGAEPEIEFDLPDFGDIAESFNTENEKSEAEFDLSDFDDIAESFQSKNEKTESDLSASDSDDLLDLLSNDKKTNTTALSNEEDIEFDLSLFDIQEEKGSDSNLSDSFNFDANGSSPKIDDSADLNNMNELETKIDLARAYIDMGDLDAAKIIAEKVLLEGNNEQKSVAQEILNSLH